MIQGWRPFAEAAGLKQGDTVTLEMVERAVMQLGIERAAAGSKKRRQPGAEEGTY